ncbi:MAG: GNAT family N-acetyltransferase [Candidatus Eisenbacteria bacterium]|uniref:GNAT family N-acetyltransferase n=1 Tax=Eiseniibacteriota bacterium TaxID=2212470 RepID=A0A538TBS1_UNCEI|nr:MAG: GNAT family N-acetyltransferase [Candidatus Eisenbacteria bacterium]
MTEGAYAFEEIQTFQEFLALEDEWNDLLDGSLADLPFLRHEWFRIWWSQFGVQHRLAIILGRRGRKVCFAAPLMERSRRMMGLPLTCLQSLTNDHSCRFDLLVREGEESALERFCGYLARRPRPWDLLLLQDVAEDSPVLPGLIRAARNAGYRAEADHAYTCPYLPLGGSWADYWSGLKPKFRSNIRNRSTRVVLRGPLDFRVASDPEQVAAALAVGIELEQRSWKGNAGSAIASDPSVAAFYTQWMQVAADRGWARLSLLTVGSEPAAFDCGLRYRDRFYSVKIGYDPEFAPYSVGQLLKRELLQRLFAEGVREYDFLGEINDSKRDWLPRTREHEWIFVYGRGILPRLHYAYKFQLRPRVKALLKRAGK